MRNFIISSFAALLFAMIFLGCSDDDNSLSPTIDLPNSPDSLTATTLSSSSVRLEWLDNSANEVGFLIEYSLTDSFYVFSGLVTEADDTTAVVDGLNASTEYYFRIFAFNDEGESEYTLPQSTVTYQSPVSEPTAPDSLELTSVSPTGINVKWKDMSDNEENFILEWSTEADVSDPFTALIPAGSESLTVGGLLNDTVYYFRISSVNSAGSSVWTNIISLETYSFFSGTLYIESNVDYTQSANVTVYMDVSGVEDMQFRNESDLWSSWEPFYFSKSWVLSSGDGLKQVTARFRDKAGKLYVLSDEIILDTHPPVIESFRINNGDINTYESLVTLNSVVVGATQMRFKLDDNSWSLWKDYDVTAYSYINTVEDSYSYIYAEFKDDHGYTVSAFDAIKYDAYRTIRIKPWAVHVDFAGDGGSTGELYWTFTCKNMLTNQEYTLSQRTQSQYISMYEGQTVMLYNDDTYSQIVEFTLPRNVNGNDIGYEIQFFEYDSDNADESTLVNSTTSHSFNDWDINVTQTMTAGDIYDPLRATIYFRNEYVD